MDRTKVMPPLELMEREYHPLRYSYVSLEGFLNAKLLVEIFRRMGKTVERERLKEVVESLTQVDLGIDETVSFGPNKHQGLDRVYFTTVEKGRFVHLEDWSRWAK